MSKSTLLFTSLIISLTVHSTKLATSFHAAYNHSAIRAKETLYEFTGRLGALSCTLGRRAGATHSEAALFRK
jgi:hypothetical protein